MVALRGSTGQVVWYFQVVRDLWDDDVASQPMLVTVMRDGRDIPAVAVRTKMGHLFVLHRETDEPLFPVEERPVPPSTVPGEQAWPMQPFPTVPRPLVPQRLTAEDAWVHAPMTYIPGPITNEEALRAQFADELLQQTPIRPWSALPVARGGRQPCGLLSHTATPGFQMGDSPCGLAP